MRKLFSKLWFLALLSGILFSASWPTYGFPFLLFFAFIPLLVIEETIRNNPRFYKKRSVITYSYIAFLLFNASATWWVMYASAIGAILAIFINSFFMSLVFLGFHLLRRQTKTFTGILALISCWTAFEFFHLNWELAWPWLTLGNAFADYTPCVQWYEYTGTLGGTWWILIMNVLFFYLWKAYTTYRLAHRITRSLIIATAVVCFVPLLISFIQYKRYTPLGTERQVTLVQPNIDPYNEKFVFSLFKDSFLNMLDLAKTKINSSTDYVVFPETAIARNFWEEDMDDIAPLIETRKLTAISPKVNIIMGASTYKTLIVKTPTARHPDDCDTCFYDSFNTALLLDSSLTEQVYHKSKLVPGVETLPYPAVFNVLQAVAFDLGGMVGSLGIQKDRTPFTNSFNGDKLAPSICYESAFGEFTAAYVRNGANAIFIITNDGWWKDTPGYRQHFAYARLRAIETRKDVVQSANTGISGFINQRGDVVKQTQWWVPAAIDGKILLNKKKTVYVLLGDYLGRLSVAVVCALILIVLVNVFRKR